MDMQLTPEQMERLSDRWAELRAQVVEEMALYHALPWHRKLRFWLSSYRTRLRVLRYDLFGWPKPMT